MNGRGVWRYAHQNTEKCASKAANKKPFYSFFRADFSKRCFTNTFSAKIGGDIAIHGTWPREEFAVEYLQNWTLGCVSMRNDHIDELYNMVPIGTQVIIRK